MKVLSGDKMFLFFQTKEIFKFWNFLASKKKFGTIFCINKLHLYIKFYLYISNRSQIYYAIPTNDFELSVFSLEKKKNENVSLHFFYIVILPNLCNLIESELSSRFKKNNNKCSVLRWNFTLLIRIQKRKGYHIKYPLWNSLFN